MERVTMNVSGMSCGHCVSAVSKALNGLAGVHVEKVSVGSATVSFDPATASLARITQAVNDAGYQAIQAESPSAGGR